MRGLLAIALMIFTLAAGAQTPRQILPDFNADPSARVFHGVLYVYPTHDLAGSKDWDTWDWHVYSTWDMKHWKDNGVIFSLKDITWAKK